jgi:hypothetical protein
VFLKEREIDIYYCIFWLKLICSKCLYVVNSIYEIKEYAREKNILLNVIQINI